MRDWNLLSDFHQIHRENCNYFKALWGIETSFFSWLLSLQKYCNYFKALWGIETDYLLLYPLWIFLLQLFQSLMRDWNWKSISRSDFTNWKLQLFQSLMRDWNLIAKKKLIQKCYCNYFKALWGIETGAINFFSCWLSRLLQLFQSLMRDWNDIRADDLALIDCIAIISKPYEGLKPHHKNHFYKYPDCNYFKALWGIETIH